MYCRRAHSIYLLKVQINPLFYYSRKLTLLRTLTVNNSDDDP